MTSFSEINSNKYILENWEYILLLTRTIKVISLVTVFAFTVATLTVFSNMTKLRAPISTALRHRALPASIVNKITIRGQYPAFNQPCNAKLIILTKLCTRPDSHREAKTHSPVFAPLRRGTVCFAPSGLTALSFLPGHYFPAFNRSATLTPFIAGPLGTIPSMSVLTER